MTIIPTCYLGTKRTMSTLPTDIVTQEIFPKLPAKSLLRFKCVSKSFDTLISSPEFIALHLRQSLSSDSNRLLILAEKISDDLKSIDVDSSIPATSTIPIRHYFSDWPRGYVSIVGTFNGLICIGLEYGIDEGFEHILINPSTRVYRSIPHKRSHTFEDPDVEVSFGFGFDDINRDYKLVRIVQNYILEDPTVGDNYIDREVMVYSLNENSWKLVENVTLYETAIRLKGRQSGVLMNNHLLHWVFWCSNRFRICCFDVQSDSWANDVPLMDLFTYRNPSDRDKVVREVTLGVVDGCLYASTITNLSRVVWVMKEYGVKESWVKLFEIPPHLGRWNFLNIGPFGFRRGSKHEVLVRTHDKSKLFWCDIRSGTYGRTEDIKDIPIFNEA